MRHLRRRPAWYRTPCCLTREEIRTRRVSEPWEHACISRRLWRLVDIAADALHARLPPSPPARAGGCCSLHALSAKSKCGKSTTSFCHRVSLRHHTSPADILLNTNPHFPKAYILSIRYTPIVLCHIHFYHRATRERASAASTSCQR